MAFTMLEFGVMNNAGFTVITGEIGSGKTTLVRHLLKNLPPNISTGLISNSPQGRQELLQWILMSLGRPFDGDYPDLVQAFAGLPARPICRRPADHADHRRGAKSRAGGARTPANALQHQRRQASDPAADSGRSAAAAGRVAGAATASICAADFVRLPSQGDWGRGTSSITSPSGWRRWAPRRRRGRFSRLEACAKIAAASGGIPRMINILCDTALVYGFARGEKTIPASWSPTSLQTSNSTAFFRSRAALGAALTICKISRSGLRVHLGQLNHSPSLEI